MPELVSRRELARRLGVTDGAVRKHLRSGLYRTARNGLIDVELATAAYATCRDPDAVIRGAAGAAARKAKAEAPTAGDRPVELPAVGNKLVDARAAVAGVQAERQALALARERGELVPVAEAVRAVRQLAVTVAERLDGLPSQVGQRGAGKGAVEIERICREALAAVKAEIARLPVVVGGVKDE